MKTVSNEFLDEQAKHHFKYYRHVTLYRRTWNGSAYVLDSGTNIDNYVIRTGKAVASVDVISNEWRTGNFDITVKNTSREWCRDNPDGLWVGSLPEFSECSLEFGYIDSGDVERGVALFRGVITFEGVKEDLENKTAALHIRGYQDILNKFRSEELPDNQVTGSALIGAVNGVNTTFTTTDNGIGIVNAVYNNGTAYEVNVYTVSDLNIKGSPATIEMDTAPIAGAMTADYVKWYQDKTFKYLIEKLLDYAEITNREIQEVTFPENVGVDFTQNTDAHFNAGTMDGNLYIEDNALKMPIAKQLQYYSGGSFALTVSGYKIAQSFKIRTNSGTVTEIGIYSSRFMSSSPVGDARIEVALRQDDAGLPAAATLATVNLDFNTSETWHIERITGFSQHLSADTTYWVTFENKNSNGGIHILRTLPPGAPDRYTDGETTTDYNIGSWSTPNERDMGFYIRYTADNYKWMSVTEDCGINLEGWGTLLYSGSTLGNYTFYTKTKTAGEGGANPASWPATFNPAEWDVVGLGGIINSDLKRYLRVAVRIQYNPQAADNNEFPLVSYINIRYYTSTFNIKLANFTGQSVRDSIREMAIICDYQFGFDALGKFFWRAKEISPATDLYLYGITKITNYRVYWELLRNKIIATFGEYSKTVSSITEGEAQPNSIRKFGTREFSIPTGNLLNDDNVDVATGSGQRQWNNYHLPKRGCLILCKSFAQLDLGDIIVPAKYGASPSATLYGDHLYDDFLYGDDYDPPYEVPMRTLKIIVDSDFLVGGGMEIEAMEV